MHLLTKSIIECKEHGRLKLDSIEEDVAADILYKTLFVCQVQVYVVCTAFC